MRFKLPYLLSCIKLTILFLIMVLSSSHFLANANAQTDNCQVSTDQLVRTEAEKKLFDTINTYRVQNGAPILVWSQTLKKAAAWHSRDMASKNYFNHTDSLGRNPGKRLTDCGYSWTTYAENIFPNSSDPQVVFDSWKNSSSHNSAMLNSEYSQAGIGSDGIYWTLDLASSTNSSIQPTITQEAKPTLLPNTIITTNPTLPITTPKLSPTSSIILDPKDTIIQLNIKLAGIGKGKNESPRNLTRLVEVNIFNLENKKILSGVGHLKYNSVDGFIGNVHLGQIPDGAYYIKVQGKNTLTALIVPEFQTLSNDRLNILPQITLTQGDFNSDNVINIRDFNIALLCFQKKACTSDIAIDLNDDSASDVIDYNIFLASFKRSAGD